MALSTERKEFRFTGFHMMVCMVAFFGVIIAVNITMATFASRSWTGLVVKNSYVASQKFNATLAKSQAQAERGWNSDVSYENGQLTFTLRDRSGNLIDLREVEVLAGRPAFEQQDQKFSLTSANPGQHGTDVALEDGTWMMQINATTESFSYRRDLRIHVKQGVGKIL